MTGEGSGNSTMWKGSPSRFAGRAQAIDVFGERQVVLVVRVCLNGSDDCIGADEAGDVVDVAVGVVAGDAAVHPEHLVDAEVVAEDALQLIAAEAGVALLDLAEQALFGGEQDAGSVGVDAAAFEDDAMRGAVGKLRRPA